MKNIMPGDFCLIKRILKRIDVPFWNGCNMKIKTLEKSRAFKSG
jgi:hypothetical protein